MMKSKLLSITIALAALNGCKSTEPQSALDSGFVGNDCASARADLAVQAPKLAEAKQLFKATYDAWKNVQEGGANLMLDDERLSIADDIKSEADCNTKLLAGGGTATASSQYQDVYQKCVDYYKVYAKVKARETKLDTTECKQGTDLGTIIPTYISSCDTPCTFTNVECGLVELDVDGAKRRFACGTTRAATDAAKGYCREFNVAEASCKVGAAILKKGNEIAQAAPAVAGSNNDKLSLALTALGAGVASAEYKGGVVVSGEARIEFKATGTITLELNNGERSVRAGEFLQPGTDASCKINITGFETGSVKAFVGVGGSFELFGNGVTAKAGAEGSLALALSRAIESTLGKVDGGGLESSVVIERCIPLAKAWLVTNLSNEFKPFAERLAQHIDEFKEAQRRAADAAFNALSRGEEGVDTIGKSIFCETNQSATFSSGNKVYRINKFFASVGSGVISVKVWYEGSINPFSGTSNTMNWNMKGNARGERLVQEISRDGVGSVSDDDIRWLLTDMIYADPDKKFTDCSKTGF